MSKELSINAALQQGIDAQKEGKIQEADRCYTAILKVDPGHPDANHNLGVLALGIGKPKQALPFFKRALENKPTIEQFWRSYINILIKLDQKAEAKSIFDQAKNKGIINGSILQLEDIFTNKLDTIIKKPESELFNEAVVNRELGRYDKAIEILNVGLTHSTQNPDILALLSHCYILKNDLDNATKYLNKASNIKSDTALVCWNSVRVHLKRAEFNEALAIAQRTHERFPEDIEGLVLLGSCLRSTDKSHDSFKFLNKAIELNPRTAEAYISRGLSSLALEDRDRALKDLNRAYQLKPHIKQIWDLMIGLKVEAKDFLEAISNLLEMINIDPSHDKSLKLLISLHEKLGDPTLAINSFKKVIELLPKEVSAHINLGIAYILLGKNDNAIKTFKKALSINPDNPVAYCNMGNAFFNEGKLSQAVGAYKRAIEIMPKYADAHNNLGNVLHNQNQYEEAIAAYRKATEIKPDFVEAYFNIGNVLKAQSKYEAAINAYDKALSLRADYIEAYNNKGNAFREISKFEEAVTSYENAISIRADYFEAYNNMGSVFIEQGKFFESVDILNKAINIEPDYDIAWHNIFSTLQSMKAQHLHKDLSIFYPAPATSKYSDVRKAILNLKLRRRAEDLKSALSYMEKVNSACIKNPQSVKTEKETSSLDCVIVALVHFGRSGTGLLHSLLDGHPEVSTLPSIYFSEYFDMSTWDKITAGGWNFMVRCFVDNYDVLFNASSSKAVKTLSGYLSSIGEKEGLTNVGEHSDEVLTLNKELFMAEMDYKIKSFSEIDALTFFKLVHLAYNKAIFDENKKSLIFYHIHNPSASATLNLVRLAPQSKWIMMIREPLQSCESWLRNPYSKNNLTEISDKIFQMLFDLDNIAYSKQSCVGVRLEDLKNRPKKTIKALCNWLHIEETESLYEMTMQGKKWWGDPNSPDYLEDGMEAFGKTSINRQVGLIFGENDQLVFNTLFYPISTLYGYLKEDKNRFEMNLKKIKPMLLKLFEFEKDILERTEIKPEEYMKSGSYCYLRSGLIERWETLNKHGTYPNMIKPLEVV